MKNMIAKFKLPPASHDPYKKLWILCGFLSLALLLLLFTLMREIEEEQPCTCIFFRSIYGFTHTLPQTNELARKSRVFHCLNFFIFIAFTSCLFCNQLFDIASTILPRKWNLKWKSHSKCSFEALLCTQCANRHRVRFPGFCVLDICVFQFIKHSSTIRYPGYVGSFSAVVRRLVGCLFYAIYLDV